MESNNTETLHEQHTEWMQELTNWHNELVYYSRVLLRLVEGVKTGPDTAKMEEFQSRFDIMQEHFDIMTKSINAHDRHLDQNQQPEHLALHRQMDQEVKSFKGKFNELKNDFYKFEEKFIYE